MTPCRSRGEPGAPKATNSLIYLYLTGNARAQQRPAEANAQYDPNDDQGIATGHRTVTFVFVLVWISRLRFTDTITMNARGTTFPQRSR
jgi:hypothetical protein